MTDSQIMILYENSLDSHWRHLVCPKGAFKFYVIALGGGWVQLQLMTLMMLLGGVQTKNDDVILGYVFDKYVFM